MASPTVSDDLLTRIGHGEVADLVTGRVTLPSYEQMRAQITAYDEAVRRRFVASNLHTIKVDFHAYCAELEKERRTRRGRRVLSRVRTG